MVDFSQFVFHWEVFQILTVIQHTCDKALTLVIKFKGSSKSTKVSKRLAEKRLLENLQSEKKAKVSSKVSSNDIDLDEFEEEMGWSAKVRKPVQKRMNLGKIIKAVDPVEKVLAKSAIRPGFEQLDTVPPYKQSLKKLRAQRQKEREKTKGKKWFDMPAPEMTDEVKHDLEIIQMRSVLDPKRFYKKNDIKVLPKYFQIGKVMDAPLDYYNSRLTKKERKRTIVDELMADAEFSKFNKRKYKEIVEEKNSKTHMRAHRHARKLKGKKK